MKEIPANLSSVGSCLMMLIIIEKSLFCAKEWNPRDEL